MILPDPAFDAEALQNVPDVIGPPAEEDAVGMHQLGPLPAKLFRCVRQRIERERDEPDPARLSRLQPFRDIVHHHVGGGAECLAAGEGEGHQNRSLADEIAQEAQAGARRVDQRAIEDTGDARCRDRLPLRHGRSRGEKTQKTEGRDGSEDGRTHGCTTTTEGATRPAPASRETAYWPGSRKVSCARNSDVSDKVARSRREDP